MKPHEAVLYHAAEANKNTLHQHIEPFSCQGFAEKTLL